MSSFLHRFASVFSSLMVALSVTTLGVMAAPREPEAASKVSSRIRHYDYVRNGFDIHLDVPQLVSSTHPNWIGKVNSRIKKKLVHIADAFAKDNRVEPIRPNFFYIAFEEGNQSPLPQFFSFRGEETRPGGVHPLHSTVALNYDRNGNPVTLEQIVNSEVDYELLSDYCRWAKIKEGAMDEDWLRDGLDPSSPENFHNFVLTDAGVEFTFDEYQIACYADGASRIVVPYGVFREVVDESSPIYALANNCELDEDDEQFLNPDMRDTLIKRAIVQTCTSVLENKGSWLSEEHLRYRRADAYADLGDYEKALSDYNFVLVSKVSIGGLAGTYFSRGFCYARLGYYQQAITDFNQALSLDPEYSDVYRERGMAYFEVGENKRAVPDLMKATELNDDDAEAFDRCGSALMRLGEAEQALEFFKSATLLAPDEAAYWLHYANAELITGHFGDAIKHYCKTLELDWRVLQQIWSVATIFLFRQPNLGCVS